MNEIAPRDASGGLLNFIERASRDPDFDVHKLGELLRMQRELVQEQAQREFNQAMAAAQTEMLPIVRDAQNPHTKSRYAKLETIDAQMRPIYTSHGFAVRFGSAPSPREGWMRIVCTVSHTGGYSEVNYLDAPPDDVGARGGSSKTGVQGVGSAVTYLRRYLLCMVFNIVLADQDDDGEGRRQSAPVTRREQINRAIPMDEPPPPRMSWSQLIQSITLATESATDGAEIEHVLTSPEVERAKQHVAAARPETGQAFEAAIAAAEERQAQLADDGWDPIAPLVAKLATMDLDSLNSLHTNADWLTSLRDVRVLPPDEERLREAIAARKQQLQGKQ